MMIPLRDLARKGLGGLAGYGITGGNPLGLMAGAKYGPGMIDLLSRIEMSQPAGQGISYSSPELGMTMGEPDIGFDPMGMSMDDPEQVGMSIGAPDMGVTPSNTGYTSPVGSVGSGPATVYGLPVGIAQKLITTGQISDTMLPRYTGPQSFIKNITPGFDNPLEPVPAVQGTAMPSGSTMMPTDNIWGDSVPQSPEEVAAAIARLQYEQTDPIRQSLISRYEDFLGGDFDPTASPLYATYKNAAEREYRKAKDAIMSKLPTGGTLLDALSGAELAKARTMVDAMGGIGADEYNKLFSYATGVPAQSQTGLLGAGQIEASLANQAQQVKAYEEAQENALYGEIAEWLLDDLFG